MKRKIELGILLTILAFALCSCGGDTFEKKILQTDLKRELQNTYSFLKLEDYEVVKSVTEEKSYSATISAVAQSNYAKFDLIGEVQYTKYDQGWICDYCNWQVDSYEVNKWPTKKVMDEEFLEDRRYHFTEQDKVKGCLEYPQYTKLSNNGVDVLFYEGTVDTDYKDFVHLNGSVESMWIYDAEEDTFYFEDDVYDIELSLIANIEGTWMDSGSIILGNYFAITEQEGTSLVAEAVNESIRDTVYLETTFDEFLENEYLIFCHEKNGNKTKVTVYYSTGNRMILDYSYYKDNNYRISRYTAIPSDSIEPKAYPVTNENSKSDKTSKTKSDAVEFDDKIANIVEMYNKIQNNLDSYTKKEVTDGYKFYKGDVLKKITIDKKHGYKYSEECENCQIEFFYHQEEPFFIFVTDRNGWERRYYYDDQKLIRYIDEDGEKTDYKKGIDDFSGLYDYAVEM